VKIKISRDKEMSGYFSLEGLCVTRFGKLEIPEEYTLVVGEHQGKPLYNVEKSQ
jgi:hypothetical protein